MSKIFGTVKRYQARNNEYAIEIVYDELLPESDAAHVGDYIVNGDRSQVVRLSGGRSVFLKCDARAQHALRPDVCLNMLKIKGCGLNGGGIDWNRQHMRGGPMAPFYDWEGRFAEDVARGFDYPHPGGMTYQMALNEYRMANALQGHGFLTFPGVGYGAVTKLDTKQQSFFVLLLFSDRSYRAYDNGMDDFVHDTLEYDVAQGILLRDMALKRIVNTQGQLSYCNGEYYLVDLHMSRVMHPGSESIFSMTMYLIYDFILNAESTMAHDIRKIGPSSRCEADKNFCYIMRLALSPTCGNDITPEDIVHFRDTSRVNHKLTDMRDIIGYINANKVRRRVFEFFADMENDLLTVGINDAEEPWNIKRTCPCVDFTSL